MTHGTTINSHKVASNTGIIKQRVLTAVKYTKPKVCNIKNEKIVKSLFSME